MAIVTWKTFGFNGELGLDKPGPVAFISQSGGHTGDLPEIGLARGIRFSKLVNFGSGCDLDSGGRTWRARGSYRDE